MTRLSWIQTSLAAILMFAPAPLGAQTAKPAEADKPISITATIEAIDRTARLITLKGPKGNLATVYADQSVKRFDELKVGDKVTASYYESIGVRVRRPGEPAPPAGSAAVTPSAGAPGATASVQETVTVTVQEIDKANQAVTVKRQDGSVISFRVQNPQYLEGVKAGDTVDVTLTRALLVAVNPSK